VHTIFAVEFEWDEKKARENLRKHGVDFADATVVLSDEMAITLPDQGEHGEERFVTVGSDALGRVVVLAYRWRGESRVRIISARKATRREQKQYEGKRR